MMRLYYQLSKSPATFDYVNFLVRAEQERLKRQQDSISIRISYGERSQSQRDVEFGKERKLWRINNLLMPLSRCLPSVVDVALGDGEQTLSYLPFTGPQKPVLEAPKSAVELVKKYLEDKPNPITITMRDSDFESGRNSNVPAWVEVARWLSRNNYTPIFVPDTEAEITGGRLKVDYYVYSPAAFYPELRLALFEACQWNLMSAGGPMEMCLQSEVSVMIWKLLVPGMPMNTEDNMQKRGLLRAGWSSRKRFYTEPDTAENIIGAIEKELRLAA
jgi:hypothetical protein